MNSYYKIFIYSNIRDFASNYLLYNDLKNKNNAGCDRACDLFRIDTDYLSGKGRQKVRVRARDLVSYRAVNEWGMSMVDVARRFDVTPSAVGYSVQREENSSRKKPTHLKRVIFDYLRTSPFSLFAMN